MANMRVVYNNIVDLSTTTVTASTTFNTTTTPVANMATDTKSKVWRSGTTTVASTNVTATLAVTFPSTTIGAIVLPFTNLNSSTATIRVIGYTGANASVGGTANAPTFTAGGTQVFDTGTISACPWNSLSLPNWGGNPSGFTPYSYGGGTYIRAWLNTQVACTSIVIVITDNYSTSAAGRFIEASRLVVGPYWSPKYSTTYGLSSTVKDMSTHERTHAGDLVSMRAPRYNSISFDLKYLVDTDRVELTKFLLGNGLPRPVLVSLFPSDTIAEKERAHMVYGKLMTMPGITLDNPLVYSAPFEIEEV